MDVSSALKELKEEIQKIVSQGQNLNPQGTIDYINLLLEEVAGEDASESERRRAIADLHLAAYTSERAAALQHQALIASSDLEAFRVTIQAGAIARKDLLIINGGASVALLALLGHFVASGKMQATMAFAPVLLSFSLGVAMCALCSASTYVSQAFYQHEIEGKKPMLAWIFHGLALAFWLSGAASFVYGAVGAATLFTKPFA